MTGTVDQTPARAAPAHSAMINAAVGHVTRAVFDRARGPITFAAATSFAALVATMSLVYATDLLGLLTVPDETAESLTDSIVSAMVVAPLVENVLLFVLIELLATFGLRAIAITWTVAILSGGAHWLAGEWRAYAGAVLFAVMTHTYFLWNHRTIGWRYRLTVLQHFLFNAPATLLLAWTT